MHAARGPDGMLHAVRVGLPMAIVGIVLRKAAAIAPPALALATQGGCTTSSAIHNMAQP